MALLETTQTSAEVHSSEAADSRYFYAQHSSERMRIDVSNLQQLSREALAYAGLVLSTKGGTRILKRTYELGLNEALTALEAGLRIDNGVLRVEIADYPIAPADKLESLIADYGQKDSEQVIELPAVAVTAANVLAFPGVEDDYQPVVDLRVQTSADQGTSLYDGAGKITEIASPGSWFRFNLGGIVLAHLTDVK